MTITKPARLTKVLMGIAAVVVVAVNMVPSGFLRIGFVSERGWPFRWWHVCDVCAGDGGYRYYGELTLNILIGISIVLFIGFLAETISRKVRRSRNKNHGNGIAEPTSAGDVLKAAPEK